MPGELDPKTREFYRDAMTAVGDAGIPFLVGGAYALERYTGIERHTKDIDIFVRPADAPRVLDLFAARGHRAERTHPHWLGKVYARDVDAFLDVIYRSGNGVCEVDDAWFEHAIESEVVGLTVGLCPVEEILWCKAFVMERERFDGADVAHLILSCGERLDWPRLVRRFGPHWRLLLAHVTLFGYIYPGHRTLIPERVVKELSKRLEDEAARPSEDDRLCLGTMLSRSQYLVDVERRGFRDARLGPGGTMTPEDVAQWTAAIAIDGSR
jgi:hypothetical protein